MNPTLYTYSFNGEKVNITLQDLVNIIKNLAIQNTNFKHFYKNYTYFKELLELNKSKIYGIENVVEALGKSFALCVTEYDNAYCINITIVNNTLYLDKSKAKRFIYIEKDLFDKIKSSFKQDDEKRVIKLVIDGIKEGKIKGIKISDIRILISKL